MREDRDEGQWFGDFTSVDGEPIGCWSVIVNIWDGVIAAAMGTALAVMFGAFYLAIVFG